MLNIQRLPPIQYLPAFVAAASHNSFKLAAKQLHVSPSAISQQIKTLEGHVGMALFSREKKTLRLTQAGEHFYQIAQTTLSHYESGCGQFTERYFSSSLKISMTPYIANELVIPKLYDFQQKYPDINLLVQTSTQLENVQDSELDAAIRFGIPPWSGHDVQLICPAFTALVATPEYFAKHPIKTMSDWQQQTFIHSRSNVNDWQTFMDKIQCPYKAKKEWVFDSYETSIKAAEEGLGLAMGVLPISSNKIKQGKLSVFSPNYSPLKEAFYLVSKPNDNKQKNYQALLTWLKALFNEL